MVIHIMEIEGKGENRVGIQWDYDENTLENN